MTSSNSSEAQWNVTVAGSAGTAPGPKKCDKPKQHVVCLGLAYSETGIAIGALQEALLKTDLKERARARVGGKTNRGNTGSGRGWIDQWFNPSWTPPRCRVEKTEGYHYADQDSRIRVIPETVEAKEKLDECRQTAKRHGLCD